MIQNTKDRVPQHTSARSNHKIRRNTQERVLAVASGGLAAIEQRLEELDAEWDVERVLETNASAAVLVGVALGTFVHRRFFAIPAIVGGFLLQHALQGWCPPLPLFRRMGFRTADEINQERYALKTLRGDFARVVGNGDPAHALRALEAARA
jgi:hypothetical protein